MKISDKVVELKGYRDGLHLIIDPRLPFAQIESAIIERLANIGDSLSGIQISLDIGDRILGGEELHQLQELLSNRYKLEIKQLNSDSRQTLKFAEKLETKTVLATRQAEESQVEEIQVDGKSEMTRLVRHTLRSGQRERFLEGNIVVIGDVNPGGEVIASGDIIVLGALRGMAHAGALGDASALIIALDLKPTQLRIGKVINRPPTGNITQNKNIPEMAKVEGNIIKVSPYKKL
jgi:septum site-determining protein MinC